MSERKIELQVALLRRKELAGKIAVAAQIKSAQVYELKVTRKAVHEGIDDITAQVPRLSLAEVMAEHDFYAKQLRLLDAIIQKANWSTMVDAEQSGIDLFADYPLVAKV